MTQTPHTSRGLSPRAFWTTVALVATVGLLIISLIAFISIGTLPDNGVVFKAPGAAQASLAAVLPTPLRIPQGMDANDSRLFVAESDAGAVVTLGPRGQQVATTTVAPMGSVKVAYPTDVALFNRQMVVIDQTGNGAALLVPLRGTGRQTRIGEPGSTQELVRPTAVAADAREVFIADSGSHTIKVYDGSLNFVREIGDGISPNLGFVGGLLVDTDLLWIADSNAGRVLAIDRKTGKLMATAKGKMQLPRGMTRDTFGRIYVADEFAHMVWMFDRSGKAVGVVGDEKTEGYDTGGRMTSPRDLVWLQGRLYVADRGANTIRVYNVKQP